VSSDLAVQLAYGKLASNRPRTDPFDPIANFYKTRDERWLVLNPRGGAKDWPATAAAVGRPDLLEDERFKTGRSRKAHNRDLVAELDQAFGALDFEEAARRLDAADLVWAPVQTPAEVAADPQAAAAGAWVQVQDGQGGTYRSPAAPARFPGADLDERPPFPTLGEHTAQVLGELGYSEAEIAAMTAEGAAV
jgi:crotonobetainyl-CoA:carnitine CoA-transferase CaiB-like acyl-CoA transferase